MIHRHLGTKIFNIRPPGLKVLRSTQKMILQLVYSTETPEDLKASEDLQKRFRVFAASGSSGASVESIICQIEIF